MDGHLRNPTTFKIRCDGLKSILIPFSTSEDIKTHHWCIEPISATKDEVEKLQKSFGWLDDISSRVFTMD